ncbi:hypothetical protein PUN28_018766 [Cardiocondyla obscurior]|uniref:Protein takeout n=1 Tax=Cardiocondyla obscurior TaxID=286306 RepID=A0AAW2EDX2_9HYME
MQIDAHIFTFLFLTSGFVAVRTGDIPLFLKKCHRSDPNLNECIKQSIELLKPYLRSGIPALQIPPCEPLRIPQIEISQSSGPIFIESTYTDIEVQGGINFILKNFNMDMDNERITLELYFPRLEMNAHYNIEGKIMMLPIKGNGLAQANFTDIDVVAIIQGNHYQDQKTGEVHYRFTDLHLDFDVKQANIHLDNLFNGNTVLANATNLFLNDNWNDVKVKIKPVLEKTISGTIKTISDKIYSKFSLDTILPP